MVSNDLHHDRTNVNSSKYPVVFCPKYRRKVLVPPMDDRIKALLLEKQDENGYTVIEKKVMADHVHLLLDVDRRIDVVVGKIKGYTADTIRKEYPWMKSRQPSFWTSSRFIVSEGAVSLEAVKQ